MISFYKEFMGVSIQIIKKPIRSLNLYVKPPQAKVIITAPLHIREEALERFINEKIEWIKQKQKKILLRPQQAELTYQTGDMIYLWGKKYLLTLENNTKTNLCFYENTVVLSTRPGCSLSFKAQIFHEYYIQVLQAKIKDYLLHWEQITGLRASQITIKNMTSQWGSCHKSTKKISINFELVKKNLLCLECVILHELLHFVELRHNQHFYALLDKYMPNWREAEYHLYNN